MSADPRDEPTGLAGLLERRPELGECGVAARIVAMEVAAC